MRELTKSAASYTWAMSIFGVQQAANVLQFVNGGGTVFYSAQNRLQGTSLGGMGDSGIMQAGARAAIAASIVR